MNNYSEAVKANNTALHSQGSAQKENYKQLDSIKGKISEFTAAWNEMILGDGGIANTAKYIIQLGTDFIKFADSDVGKVVIEFSALTIGSALLLNNVSKVVLGFEKLKTAFKMMSIIDVVKNFSNLSSAIKEAKGATTVVEEVGTEAEKVAPKVADAAKAVGEVGAAGTIAGGEIAAGAGAAEAGSASLLATLTPLLSTLAPFLVGGVVALGFYEIYKHVLSVNGQLEQSKIRLKETQDELTKNQKKTKEVTSEYDKLKKKKNLTGDEKARLEYLKLQLDDLKSQTAELKKQEKIKKNDVTNATTKKATSDYTYKEANPNYNPNREGSQKYFNIKGSKGIKEAAKEAIGYTQKIKDSKKATDSLKDAEAKLLKQYKAKKITTKQYENQMDELEGKRKKSESTTLTDIDNQSKLAKSFKPVLAQYNKKVKSGQKLTKEEKANAKAMLATVDANAKNVGSSKKTSKEFESLRKTVGSTKSTIKEYTEQDAKGKSPDLTPWQKLKNAISDAINNLLTWNSTKVSNKKVPGTANNKSGLYNAQATGGESHGGKTLVNELGAELIESGDGAYVANGGKPTIVNLKKGDYVYTAEETKGIISGNSGISKIQARASGTSTASKARAAAKRAAAAAKRAKAAKLKKAKGKADSTLTSLETRHDMDLISDAKYYDKLESLSKKYYKKKLIASGTYKSNIKSVHDYESELAQKALDEKLARINTESGYTDKNNKKYMDSLKKAYKQHKLSYTQYKEDLDSYYKAVTDHYKTSYEEGKTSYSDYKALLEKYVKSGKIQWSDYYTYIDDLNKESLQKQQDSLNTQQTVMEWYATKQQNAISTQIAALEAQKDKIEANKDEADSEEQLLTLQKALANAQKEKIRVFKDGMWQYTQNDAAVQEAQKALDDYQAEKKEQADVKAIEDQITALQSQSDAWGQYVTDYEDLLTKLQNEKTLGTTYEDFLSGLGITSVQSFINALTSLAKNQSTVSGELSGYASGTDSVSSSGVYKFNEKGNELLIPNNINYVSKGTGVIPHTMSQNLKEIGTHNWDEIKSLSNANQSNIDSHNITIKNLTVEANNPQDFVKKLQNLVNVS